MSYDAMNRVTQSVVDYAYDGLGRRASRTINHTTTNFLYDGADVVLDRRSDSTSVSYLNGIGIDDKLRQASNAASSLYFLQDHLGSTTALTDASGAVVERQQYEPFGASMGTSLTRYGYTGREKDEATGLLYYRARWYDPEQGRFITQDPIGFAGGDTNLYAYVGNEPVSFADPLGLERLHRYAGTWPPRPLKWPGEKPASTAEPVTDLGTVPQQSPSPSQSQSGCQGCNNIPRKLGVPPPSSKLCNLLSCMNNCLAGTGFQMVLTSTTDSHKPGTPHMRGEAADIKYTDQGKLSNKVLGCAAKCGAGFALDEGRHPSAKATGPHYHVQLGPGKGGGRGHLPKLR
ncbi:MAG: RHS repeat-associated core domain-containing protein [Acidobacteriota bacterium]